MPHANSLSSVTDTLITDTPSKGVRGAWSKTNSPAPQSPDGHNVLGDLNSPSLHRVGFAPSSRDWSPFLRSNVEGVSDEILTFPEISSPLAPKFRQRRRAGSYSQENTSLMGSPGNLLPLTPGFFLPGEDERGKGAGGEGGEREGGGGGGGGGVGGSKKRSHTQTDRAGGSYKPPAAPGRYSSTFSFTPNSGKTSQSLLNYFKLDVDATGVMSPGPALDLGLMETMNITGGLGLGTLIGDDDDSGHGHGGHSNGMMLELMGGGGRSKRTRGGRSKISGGLPASLYDESDGGGHVMHNDDSNMTLSSSDASGVSGSSTKPKSRGGSSSHHGGHHDHHNSDLSEKERKEARALERAQQKELKARRAEDARLSAMQLNENARIKLRARGLDDDASSDMHHMQQPSSGMGGHGGHAPVPFGSPPSVAMTKSSARGGDSSNMVDSISPHAATKPAADEEVRCNCRRSRCLKLYCDCFRKQHFCTGDCRCSDCENNMQYEESRTKAIRQILEGRPDAFKPRVDASSEDGKGGAAHLNGCHCKKSACLKKYCECFGAKVFCGTKCRCSNCKNLSPDGDKRGGDNRENSAEVKTKKQKVSSSSSAKLSSLQSHQVLPVFKQMDLELTSDDSNLTDPLSERGGSVTPNSSRSSNKAAAAAVVQGLGGSTSSGSGLGAGLTAAVSAMTRAGARTVRTRRT